MSIKLLTKDVINKISAGEVVEKPASIVKELVENSIDAGATSISIEIENGGISKICVVDNGCGIKKDEVKLAFTPHATSKLTQFEDLNNLNTMGFRGEALSTISAVSKVSLITKTSAEDVGTYVEIISGEEILRKEIACNIGTKIEVKDVFYNTPARLKFLRKPKSEEADITNYVEKLILSNSKISFKYIVNGKLVYNTIGSNVLDNIYTIYGKETASNMLEVNYSLAGYKIFGYISKPEFSKANRTYQNLFVNSRFCSNSLVSTAVSNAYENFAMKGKFPIYVLFINLPQNELDVNVHPNKLEVKFTDTQKIYKLCNDAIFKTLSDSVHIKKTENEISTNVEFANAIKVEYSVLNNGEGVSFIDNQKTKNDIEDAKQNFQNFFEEQDGSLDFELTNNLITEKEKNEILNNGITNSFDNNSQSNFLNTPKEINLSETISKINNLNTNNNFQQDEIKNILDENYKIVGKAFNTYLILEYLDKLYFVDQHAGHERLKYDELVKNIENSNLQIQNLLVPYIFSVNSLEYNFIINNLCSLMEFGIDICEFGVNTFKISALPLILSDINIKLFIDDLLKNISGLAKSPKQIIKEKLMQMACKSAVRGGDDLKDIEIKSLLNKLKKENTVLLCPHGRPVIIEISKSQIEKWFKRIV